MCREEVVPPGFSSGLTPHYGTRLTTPRDSMQEEAAAVIAGLVLAGR
jgi:hypothetical protein